MIPFIHTSSSFRTAAIVAILLPAACQVSASESPDVYELPEFVVESQTTANLQPVTTYETPVSNLDFEPRIDLQSRNMAEAQGDVTIRGGIFENTGFRVGSATLLDPQTGHYFAELPIAPEMLDGPVVHTGAENALYGFNSTVGTLGYGWTEIAQGGSVTVGAGEHDLNFQRVRAAFTRPLSEGGDWQMGLEAEASRSESDGTRRFGDHDFERFSGRVQLLGPRSQTDLFAGYQAKFFGWPMLYTPYGNETEDLNTRLFILNHRQDYGDGSHWEATAYHRRHSDRYFLDAFGGITIDHETKAAALGLSGLHRFTERAGLNYALQATGDEIESTDLEQGDFTSRDYLKFSLLPEYTLPLDEVRSLTFRAGASFDDSNRDDSEISPIAEISWQARHANGHSERVYLAHTQTSQVPGYTAIGGSETIGLFRSNHDLDRETSRNLELGLALDRGDWKLEGAVFHRWDDDLVDWTFTGMGAREAENVDVETFGFELIGVRSWGDFEGVAGYTYLHKDEDYGNPAVAGSFYALNFPEHRATLGLIWRPLATVELRLDNEWRTQEDNPLRDGPHEALFTHFGLSYFPSKVKGLEIFAAIDKPWDEDFQEVPGTPGRGDLVSGGVTYRW
ncbi:MAG: TonB-dependent receptor plug domain-containing protein [Opitutales bacterium]